MQEPLRLGPACNLLGINFDVILANINNLKIMARLVNKNKEEIGHSPSALVFHGAPQTGKITLTAFDYNTNDIRESEVESKEELIRLQQSTGTTSWLNVDGLHDPGLMQDIGDIFKIPRNIISYIMNTSLRPQVEEFDEGFFVSLKMIKYDEKTEVLSVKSFSLIVTKYTIISFQEYPGKEFDPVRDRLRKNSPRIRGGGTDYLCFALLDVIIDHYIYVLGLMGDKIESIEDNMDDIVNNNIIMQINGYKREINFMRKNINPAKDAVHNLLKLDSDLIFENNKTHFTELQNNMNEAGDVADSYREVLYDLLNIYHTIVGSRLNEIMKLLTIISVTFIPLSFIVGVYGMNFKNIPGTNWEYGYIAMWMLFIIIVVCMLSYFKRKKWL